MSLLPASPRARRRLGWATSLLVALVAATATVALLPKGRDITPDPVATPASAPSPATPVAAERKMKLTEETRREINETLARFIPAAVRRDDPGLAWDLSGPKLRTGWSRSDWLDDQIPIFPFPARSTGFEGWRKIYVYENRVGLDLVVHPTSRTIGALAVGVEMVRRGDRWVVNEWVPVASFTPVEGRQWVTGIADFQADGWTDKGLEAPPPLRSRLGKEWLLMPLGLLGLAILVPASIAVSVARRNRRATRAYASSATDARVTWRSS